MSTLSYAEIVRRMKLDFPIAFTVEDPFSGQPISISRENVLNLLVVDKDNPVLEAQLVGALYGEMARFRRACDLASAKAESAYRRWKAARAYELRDKTPEKKTKAGKVAARQGPTQVEIEQFYREHDDYTAMSTEPARMRAIADLFGDLMWAFKLKAEMMTDINMLVGGHAATERRADQVSERVRLTDYESMAREAARLANDDSVAAAQALAAASRGKKRPRPLE